MESELVLEQIEMTDVKARGLLGNRHRKNKTVEGKKPWKAECMGHLVYSFKLAIVKGA